jgi:hypothetical protein
MTMGTRSAYLDSPETKILGERLLGKLRGVPKTLFGKIA